ncbi:MAG: hypothetical protein H7239_12030 [Flavobacterium sp.]|nr:hypothetical protein [Flavobacterium sp.]
MNPKIVNGKIIADSPDLDGIYIVNLKTQAGTVSEKGGYFSVAGKVGDTIMFSAVQFKGLKVTLNEEDFRNALLFVKMESLIRKLDEVKIIQYKNINAVSLGIVSPNIKRYTPAERKLRTASKTYSGVGVGTTLGLSSGLDPILNAISGRTKMLKKEVEIEKKETAMDKLNNLFEYTYFTNTLKIPVEYVKGFQFYIVEEPKFVVALNGKNKTLASFLMSELAVKYLEIIKEK